METWTSVVAQLSECQLSVLGQNCWYELKQVVVVSDLALSIKTATKTGQIPICIMWGDAESCLVPWYDISVFSTVKMTLEIEIFCNIIMNPPYNKRTQGLEI